MTKIINRNTALITGGSHRIGKEMAIALAKKGYNVVIHYNNSKKASIELAEFLQKQFGIESSTISGDLFDKNSVKLIGEFMIKNFSNWNLLINNASIFNKSNFLNNLHDEFEKNLSIHLISPVYLSHFFASYVIKNKISNAQIINMIEKNTARYDTINFYYLLTKKFLQEFTKMLALQIAPNVRVNGISPGYILPDKNASKNDKIEKSKIIPLQKIGNPHNIVQTLEFLLDNDFVNGQILSIDGGASLNHAG
jgi:NAD(P)-dependent dehydrogenase (short-subunit alcohol dehydrogenase family)